MVQQKRVGLKAGKIDFPIDFCQDFSQVGPIKKGCLDNSGIHRNCLNGFLDFRGVTSYEALRQLPR